MVDKPIIVEFICSYFLTVGFAYYLYTPKKSIIKVGIIGATGWCVYKLLIYLNMDAVIATFLATCLIGLIGEMLARKHKKAATVYLLPSILPLVPGAGMYNTMMCFINKQSDGFIIGVNTLMVAGAIACGILIISSVFKILKNKK